MYNIMEANIVRKGKRIYKIFPECCYLVKKLKIIKNRYDSSEPTFKKITYHCTKMQKTIKKSYCKGCMLYKPLITNIHIPNMPKTI